MCEHRKRSPCWKRTLQFLRPSDLRCSLNSLPCSPCQVDTTQLTQQLAPTVVSHTIFLTENTTCCIRYVFKCLRPFTITVVEGGQPGGKVHSLHERPLRLPLVAAKCCCYQQIVAKDANGTVVGSVVEDCWYGVPTFKVLNQEGAHEYNIHMPTCYGGMFVDCCSQGFGNCSQPYYIYVPGKEGEGEQVGEIARVWADSVIQEIFSGTENFKLRFPMDVDAACKTRLLGATFLINQLFFEGRKS